MPPHWILASTSPFRRHMLEAAGLTVETCRPDVDERKMEQSLVGLPPRQVVSALAVAKARAVSTLYPDRVGVGADPILEIGGEIIGKPHSEEEAARRLRQLSGVTHHLMTAVAVVGGGEPDEIFVEETHLTFRTLSEAEIQWYVATGEWQGCAGGYRVEGKGVQLIAHIDGDWFNIVGLPLLRVLDVLRHRGQIGC